MHRNSLAVPQYLSNPVHAAIIGAGPYGLSLAAHLREAGVPFRIFGLPMQTWKTQTPVGMKLKSDGFASNLFAGSASYTLEDFCREFHRPYHPTHLPVAVEDFTDYGIEFARRFVPTLEPVNVAQVTHEHGLFHLTLATGETFAAQNVVVATGVSLFQHTPMLYAHLPPEMVTHTADHRDFDQFAGRDVVVLGRGASSLNAAVLLQEAGARTTLISRHPFIKIQTYDPVQTRPLWQRVRHPSSPLGTSLRSWLTVNFPGVFRALPGWLRRILVYKHLTPSGGAALAGRLEGVTLLRGWHVTAAELVPDDDPASRRIRLSLKNEAGETRELLTAHIIAGTGFESDVSRIGFLSEALRREIRLQPGGPVMRRSFESTVRGLYLIGPISAASFGPLMKFTAGAEYAARQVTASLQRKGIGDRA